MNSNMMNGPMQWMFNTTPVKLNQLWAFNSRGWRVIEMRDTTLVFREAKGVGTLTLDSASEILDAKLIEDVP